MLLIYNIIKITCTYKANNSAVDFDSIVSKSKRSLIVKYCKSIVNTTKHKNFLYFPYIPVNIKSKKINIFKIIFNEDNTFTILPHSYIKLLNDNFNEIKFSFEDGKFKYVKKLQQQHEYKIELRAYELKIKFENEGVFHTNNILLNKNFQWSSNDMIPNGLDQSVCNQISGITNTFPIPISGIVDNNNISTLIQNDSLFANKHQFAGYGKFGSKFNSYEYGECQNNTMNIKHCQQNSIYAGNGRCAQLYEPLKTCLEFPQAILKHYSDKNKFFKCLNKFPFFKEHICPPNQIYNNRLMKCQFINLCETNSNETIIIPKKLKSLFAPESYIECFHGQSIIRNCADKYVLGKLAESGNRCCDIECINDFNSESVIDIYVTDQQSFIKKYPGDIKICKGGQFILTRFYQRPHLRKVREIVQKNKRQKLKIQENFQIDIGEGEIEYDLPTFIYTIGEDKKIVKKTLQTFRDAPELFFTRKFPVHFMNENREKQLFMYIDDNLYSHVNDDLICRENTNE